MKLTKADKKEIINAAIEAAATALTHAFKTCELKDKIESMVINDDNGEEFVLTFYPSAKFSKERVKKYVLTKAEDSVLGLNNPWSLSQILKKLIEAADILLHEKNYDAHGWELIGAAQESAKKTLKLLNEA